MLSFPALDQAAETGGDPASAPGASHGSGGRECDTQASHTRRYLSYPSPPGRATKRWLSPVLMPAARAGDLSVTSATSAPFLSLRLRPSAISSVTGWICRPSQPRVTAPLSLRLVITSLAVEAGMAKPMPTLPPEGE